MARLTFPASMLRASKGQIPLREILWRPLSEIIAVTINQGRARMAAKTPSGNWKAGRSKIAAGSCRDQAYSHNRASNPSRVSGLANLKASGISTSGASRSNKIPHFISNGDGCKTEAVPIQQTPPIDADFTGVIFIQLSFDPLLDYETARSMASFESWANFRCSLLASG